MRHGESKVNAGLVAEKNDLTAKGKQQTKELKRHLAEEKIEVVYCSRSERCIQTMEEIMEGRPVDIPIYLSKLIGSKKMAEDWSEVRRRVKRFLADLKIEYEDNETVLVISHLAVLKMFWFELTGKNVKSIKNGAVAIFDYSK